jgi:hypothetical protein
MTWFDKILTRRIDLPCYDTVPDRSRSRLGLACRQLSEAERDAAKRMNLCVRPSLALIDEELAAIISPGLRHDIEVEAEHSASGGVR